MMEFKEFYNAKINKKQGPERACFAFLKYFCCFQPISWTRVMGNPHKSLFLSPMLTYFTGKSLSDEFLLKFRCQGPGIEHNGKK